MTRTVLQVNDIERQKERETDAVRDGCVRWCQNTEFQLATDTKPVRNLMGQALNSLADAIQSVQNEIKASRGAKLPKYGLPMLSLGNQQLSLITLATLFNARTSTR